MDGGAIPSPKCKSSKTEIWNVPSSENIKGRSFAFVAFASRTFKQTSAKKNVRSMVEYFQHEQLTQQEENDPGMSPFLSSIILNCSCHAALVSVT